MSPLPAATPRFTVAYGGFPLDETKGCILCSEYDAQDGSNAGSFYVEFRCRLLSPTGVVATDDATFAALVADVETSLRIPRQKLLAKFGASIFRNWDPASATETAFLITPELTLIEENCRDYRYGFRVRCEFPGNVPGNVFRRDSLTRVGTSLRERRSCAITATWTSSPNTTAYQRYLGSGDGFYNTYLPINSTDQYGTLGTWVRADEDPSFNDEVSIITATRIYWEVFAGRRESTVKTITTIGDRRVCTIPGVWVATAGFTALQNYTNNGGAFFDAALPTPVTSGEWVEVDEEPGYNDQNGVLTVVRTYHEVVGGLREYTAQVTKDPSGIRTVAIAGAYYATVSNTAKANYLAGINALVTGAMSIEGITHYESHSLPQVTGYDQNGLRYLFRWTLVELAYPQSGTSSPTWDDTNVTLETLEVKVTKPFDPQSVTGAIAVTRLKTGEAFFTAAIDKDSLGGTDPVTLWNNGLRAHVVYAITSKLGTGVTSVEVWDEEVGAGLHNNQLVGRLRFFVTGGSVLSLQMSQTITQIPGRDFADRADGTAFSLYPYRDCPEKLLHREAVVEFVIGTTPPVLFAVGDTTVSGFGMVDTLKTAQQSIDDQNADATLTLNAWFIDRRSPAPYSYTDFASTRGDGADFETVVHRQVEDWRYVEALEAGTTIT